ncbi:hypothetical protein [Nonomuraea endophytica]|uniref:Uncharacterized protein n=1 Tax=Nonomuraea endophytica TaxID=714136 RepID=A0A7W8AD31_9ACTN|nr:hypothetical protein [Nonomuraea endophytica]MBB5084062.1 hypothetical protein [Nonomuraea endophytica]
MWANIVSSSLAIIAGPRREVTMEAAVTRPRVETAMYLALCPRFGCRS